MCMNNFKPCFLKRKSNSKVNLSKYQECDLLPFKGSGEFCFYSLVEIRKMATTIFVHFGFISKTRLFHVTYLPKNPKLSFYWNPGLKKKRITAKIINK